MPSKKRANVFFSEPTYVYVAVVSKEHPQAPYLVTIYRKDEHLTEQLVKIAKEVLSQAEADGIENTEIRILN